MAIFGKFDLSASSVAGTYSFTTDQNVIIGANLANTSTGVIKVDVTLRGRYLVKGVEIPVGSSLSILDGKIVALTGDTVSVQTDGGACDAIFSTLNEAV